MENTKLSAGFDILMGGGGASDPWADHAAQVENHHQFSNV